MKNTIYGVMHHYQNAARFCEYLEREITKGEIVGIESSPQMITSFKIAQIIRPIGKLGDITMQQRIALLGVHNVYGISKPELRSLKVSDVSMDDAIVLFWFEVYKTLSSRGAQVVGLDSLRRSRLIHGAVQRVQRGKETLDDIMLLGTHSDHFFAQNGRNLGATTMIVGGFHAPGVAEILDYNLEIFNQLNGDEKNAIQVAQASYPDFKERLPNFSDEVGAVT
jgi:hypothetical protein